MPGSQPSDLQRTQCGAITIMVALMMLILLTLACIGMSRNSFREIVNSAFSRQGAQALNVSDSGLEWSLYWMDLANSPQAGSASALNVSPGGTNTASNLVALKAYLLATDSAAGTSWAVGSSPTAPTAYSPHASPLPAVEVSLPAPTGTTSAGLTLGLTRMGKLPVTDMSQGDGPGAFTPSSGATTLQAPDLWAVRSDAQVVQGGVTFIHGREAWISTPVQ